MNGLIDYVLPKVGGHVQTLDLAYGKSLTGEMVGVVIIWVWSIIPIYTCTYVCRCIGCYQCAQMYATLTYLIR